MQATKVAMEAAKAAPEEPEAAKAQEKQQSLMHTRERFEQTPVPLGQQQAAHDAGGLAHVINNIDEAERIKKKEEQIAKEAAELEALNQGHSQAHQEAEKTAHSFIHS